jgi:hypothetical protein
MAVEGRRRIWSGKWNCKAATAGADVQALPCNKGAVRPCGECVIDSSVYVVVSKFSFRNISAPTEIIEIQPISVNSVFISAKGAKFSLQIHQNI